MGTYYNLTQDELNKIIRYVEDGNKEILSTDIPTRFTALFGAFERKMSKDLIENEKKLLVLQTKMERANLKEEKLIDNGIFQETAIDSVDVANALLYCLQQLKTYKLTKSKFLLILYEMYASWLGTKKERLFIEHPVATEYGPQFWRVYKRLDLTVKVPYSAFEALAKQNSGIAAFAKNAATKYYDYSEKDLHDPVIISKAYKNALPIHNNGKWNKEISDKDIFVWKSSVK
jgi:uncharacterized phage-associated protein